MIHKLKTLPKHFAAQKVGIKNFEYRKNDRNFCVGDYILLQEWDNGYTGDEVLVLVTHILFDYEFKEVKDGHCIISTKLLK